MPQLPTPFRAAVGLVATAMDEARRLPDRAIELPMLAVSTALQVSLRAQQRYAHLTARGDEVLNHREVTDDAPPWATFDDPIPAEPPSPATKRATRQAARQAAKPAAKPAPKSAAKPAAKPAANANGAGAPNAEAKTAAAPKPKPARKTVRRPRSGKPSAFDSIGDE
jgi:hypothetical protein